MPTISVIVPVYKVEKYIHRCVDSILNQTFRDFELILVDDGSPDNCGAICDEYADKDSRIHVIHQANGGLSAARNTGIDWAFANSDSEWLTFIDSDDWVHPEYLERLLNAAMENNVKLSMCSFTRTHGEEMLPQEYETSQIWKPEDYYVQYRARAIIACAKLYSKASFENIRFPVGKIHEDEFTTYKILFAVDRIAADVSALYYYYVNNESIMNSAWTPAKMAAIDALEEQIRFFQTNNYHQAHRRAVDAAISLIHRMMNQIQETGRQYTSCEKQMKKKLRCYIRQYKKELNINLCDYCYAYETAFPAMMRLYWYAHALLRILRVQRRK